jgi:hypothetical protein
MISLVAPCAALYRYWAPQCAAGPFGTLEPLGYGLWYLHVPEGVPLWNSHGATWFVWGVFPWIGLIGALITAVHSRSSRPAAVTYCILLAVAIAIALLVTRAGAFANLLAIPGAVSLIMLAFARTESWPLPPRIVMRAVALLSLSPIAAEMAPALLSANDAAGAGKTTDSRCGLIDELKPLDRFKRTTVLAPLELGPNLLAATHHDTVTGPYHRNPSALEDVLRFFTSPDAHAIATRRNATLLVFCGGRSDMTTMAKFAPHGLAGQLMQGRSPTWLQPVSVPGTAGLRIYRIAPRDEKAAAHQGGRRPFRSSLTV